VGDPVARFRMAAGGEVPQPERNHKYLHIICGGWSGSVFYTKDKRKRKKQTKRPNMKHAAGLVILEDLAPGVLGSAGKQTQSRYLHNASKPT